MAASTTTTDQCSPGWCCYKVIIQFPTHSKTALIMRDLIACSCDQLPQFSLLLPFHIASVRECCRRLAGGEARDGCLIESGHWYAGSWQKTIILCFMWYVTRLRVLPPTDGTRNRREAPKYAVAVKLKVIVQIADRVEIVESQEAFIICKMKGNYDAKCLCIFALLACNDLEK